MVTSAHDAALARGGAYTITGGLGGLGLRAAKLLVDGGVSCVHLVSRSGRVGRHDGQGLDAQLQALGRLALARVGDVADFMDAFSLLTSLKFTGLLHAAGVLRDRMIRSVTSDSLLSVLGAKAFAAANVDKTVTALAPLESFALFSSVAATFGAVGQASYTVANAYLDMLAPSRRCRGTVASSFQIPPVSDAGMSATTFDKATLHGMGAISIGEFAAFLALSIAPPCTASEQTAVALRHVTLENKEMSALLSELGVSQQSAKSATMTVGIAHGKNEASSTLVSTLKHLARAQRQVHLETLVLRIVREMTSASTTGLTAEAPLMEAGVDSLAATEFSSQLRSLTGVTLSSTIIFDQPTSRAIAAHLLELVGDGDAPSQQCPAALASSRVAETTAPLALLGMAGRWPGGCNGESARRALLMPRAVRP
jgi:hypothetical protein